MQVLAKAREVAIQVRRASDTQSLGIYIGGQRIPGTSYASNLGPDVLTLFFVHLLSEHQIGHLYTVERTLRRQRAGPHLRAATRASQSRMVYERLHRVLTAWHIGGRISPQSSLGKAIRYALGQWASLAVYLHEVLAQQRYAKSHRILANCRGVKDFRRFRNSQDGTWFSRSVLGA